MTSFPSRRSSAAAGSRSAPCDWRPSRSASSGRRCHDGGPVCALQLDAAWAAMRAVAQNPRAARLRGSASSACTRRRGARLRRRRRGRRARAPVVFLSSKMGSSSSTASRRPSSARFGSMPGAVAGGMLLGVIENLAPLYLPSGIAIGAVPRPHRDPRRAPGGTAGRVEQRGRCEPSLRWTSRRNGCWRRWRGLAACRGWRPATSSFLASLIFVTWSCAGPESVVRIHQSALVPHAGFLAIGAYTAALVAITRRACRWVTLLAGAW